MISRRDVPRATRTVRRIDRQRGTRAGRGRGTSFPTRICPARHVAARRVVRTEAHRPLVLRPAEVALPRAAGRRRSPRCTLIAPRSFNDAQQIADRFKRDIPVIINLQNSDAALGKAADRLRIGPDLRPRRRHASASRTRSSCSRPRDVELSAEDRGALTSRASFFNQAWMPLGAPAAPAA